jgi:hypothetical protein
MGAKEHQTICKYDNSCLQFRYACVSDSVAPDAQRVVLRGNKSMKWIMCKSD